MITIAQAKISVGRSVVYTPPGNRYGGHDPSEAGVITAASDRVVFVVYRGDSAAKGTDPDDLDWLRP